MINYNVLNEYIEALQAAGITPAKLVTLVKAFTITDSKITIEKDLYIKDYKLEVDGEVRLNDILHVNGNSELYNLTLENTLTVSGDADFNSNLSVSGTVSLSDELTVNGYTNFTDAVKIDGRTYLDNNLYLNGWDILDVTNINNPANNWTIDSDGWLYSNDSSAQLESKNASVILKSSSDSTNTSVLVEVDGDTVNPNDEETNYIFKYDGIYLNGTKITS